MVLHVTMMVFGQGQLYILYCHGSFMYVIPATAKEKATGTVPLCAVILLNLVRKPSWWWQKLNRQGRWEQVAGEQQCQCTSVRNVHGVVMWDTSLSALSMGPEKAFLAHSRTLFSEKRAEYMELCVVRDGRKWQHHKSWLIWKHTLSLYVSRFLTFFIMRETCESQTPRNWFLLSSTNLSNLFQRYIQTLISYLFAGFFFPPNPCCQCLVTWTTQLLYAGKQKRFVFIDCMTGVSWSIAYAGKLLSYQQSDFWRHANSPFAAALKLGAKP